MRTNTTAVSSNYSFIGTVLLSFLIWLVMFVGMADIMALFSPFTNWVAWLIGFVIATVAVTMFKKDEHIMHSKSVIY